jgi:hypothetical protein
VRGEVRSHRPRYVFRNGAFAHPWDNMRAIEQTINLRYRALEMYGTTSTDERLEGASTDAFEQFFLGFAALPDDSALMLDSGLVDWWEVLGIDRAASIARSATPTALWPGCTIPTSAAPKANSQRIQKLYEQG